jgi:small subunit ribosomal protein S21
MKYNRDKKSKKYNNKRASIGGDSKAIEVVSDKFAHIQPVQLKPLEVKVYNNNFDKALKAFRAIVQKDRVLSIYKEKQSYEMPSQKRRRKRNEMKRKLFELEHPRPKKDFQQNRSKSFKEHGN